MLLHVENAKRIKDPRLGWGKHWEESITDSRYNVKWQRKFRQLVWSSSVDFILTRPSACSPIHERWDFSTSNYWMYRGPRCGGTKCQYTTSWSWSLIGGQRELARDFVRGNHQLWHRLGNVEERKEPSYLSTSEYARKWGFGGSLSTIPPKANYFWKYRGQENLSWWLRGRLWEHGSYQTERAPYSTHLQVWLRVIVHELRQQKAFPSFSLQNRNWQSVGRLRIPRNLCAGSSPTKFRNWINPSSFYWNKHRTPFESAKRGKSVRVLQDFDSRMPCKGRHVISKCYW